MAVKVIKEKCIMCGVCIIKCPEHAIYILDKKAFVIPKKCTDCKICIGKCLEKAIVTNLDKAE